tara:strand:+ start:212 stop:547 length:336 start_codon:yes stop_codon:yes gene_type:complete
MKVCLADVAPLDDAVSAVAALAQNGRDDIRAVTTDVSKLDELQTLCATVLAEFGEIGILMNNAVTRLENTTWTAEANWRQTFDINFMGVVNGVHAFAPGMIAQSHPSLIVN